MKIFFEDLIFNRIIHTSDIHIRTLTRHEEYREVFDNLYKRLKHYKKNSLHIISGDIVHSKLDISPELVELVSDFVKRSSDILPTLIFIGNHDTLLTNPNRLDALTPIVNAVNSKNLIFLKDSGLYKVGNITFNHWSCLDDPKKYIKGKEFEAEHKICLYHGPVTGCMTDMGFILTGDINVEDFNNHHAVLLGDIHRRQILQQSDKDKPLIYYAGSLIQQNFGEKAEGHGLSIYDIKKRTVKFEDIDNNYGFYNVYINEGIVPEIDINAKYPNVRLLVNNTDPAIIRKLSPILKKKYNIQELQIQKSSLRVTEEDPLVSKKVNLGNFRDVDFQNKLIIDYLQDVLELDQTTVNEILKLNRKYNSAISKTSITSKMWKPIKFEFNNMFSYGSDNVIEFDEMHGVYGLFATNTAGKSSLLEALLFCCFDKCSRTSKAVQVLNNKQSSFWCKFTFESSGIIYCIERRGYQRYHQFRVDVDFYRIGSDGEKISLNGKERDATNNIIRKYIGSYDDMILTSLSLQTDNTHFIDVQQRKRQELLGRFLDIYIFEQLLELAKEDYKKTATLLKEYASKDYTSMLVELSEKLNEAKISLSEHEVELKKHECFVAKLDSELKDLYKKYNSDINENTASLSELGSDLQLIETQQTSCGIEKEELEEKLQNTRHKTQEMCDRVSKLREEEEKLKAAKKRLEQHVMEKNNTEANLKQVYLKIEHNKKNLKLLESNDYDPHCKFCVSRNQQTEKERQKVSAYLEKLNEFKELAEEAIQTKKETIEYIEFTYNLSKLDELEQKNKEFIKLISEEDSIKLLLENLDSKAALLETRLVSIKKAIRDYKKNSKAIEKNLEIKEIISEKSDLLSTEALLIKEKKRSIDKEKTQVITYETHIENIRKRIEELEKFEQENKALKYYIDAIKRDSIPFRLIEKAVPDIEREVNDILSQVVDFTIKFDSKGKNINANIYYDNTNTWPVELTSGMERFISQVAIRVALINVSNLPKPNFIVIDEGWGSLTTENLQKAAPLLDTLKDMFDFTIIISHHDSMRDMVDKYINISKEKNYSKISHMS